MQNLLQHIYDKVFISAALQDRIKTDFKEVFFQKGETVLRECARANHIYFVEKGVLHNFYLHNGKEVSSWFYTENQFITAWSSFYTQKPSFETIKCLEDCTLYSISYSQYQQLIKDFPAFGNFARILAEEILSVLDEFSKSWSFLPAKEKYQTFQILFPQLEQRIKLGQIASFLGISQETLSRIRAGK